MKIFRNSEYRVLAVFHPINERYEYLICECVLNSLGQPCFFDTGNLEEASPAALKVALLEMVAAFDKPVLRIKDFECEHEEDYEGRHSGASSIQSVCAGSR